MSATTPTLLEYDVVDVFTDLPFAGNPLAVVHGADGLADAQLLAIAKEFNLSETTFPASPDPQAGERDRYATRIFTPGGEIPFAGHPTIGTAWVLRQRGLLAAGRVTQQCGAGDIEVSLPAEADGAVSLAAEPRDEAGPVDPAPYCEALGLDVRAVEGEVFIAGCGLSWVHLPVRDEAVAQCTVGAGLTSALGEVAGLRDPLAGVDVHSVTTGDGSERPLQVHARVFCPDVGIVEDPATGSAAVGLGIALARRGLLADGGDYTIRQGVEMGRPSTLHARVTAAAGRASRCEVAGGVVSVAAGTIAVPPVR